MIEETTLKQSAEEISIAIPRQHQRDYTFDAYESSLAKTYCALSIKVEKVCKNELFQSWNSLLSANEYLSSKIVQTGLINIDAQLPLETPASQTIEQFANNVFYELKLFDYELTAYLFYQESPPFVAFVISHAIADMEFAERIFGALLENYCLGERVPEFALEHTYFLENYTPDPENVTLRELPITRVSLPYTRVFECSQLEVRQFSLQESARIKAHCKTNGISLQVLFQFLHYIAKLALFPCARDQYVSLLSALNYSGQPRNCPAAEIYLIELPTDAFLADADGLLRRCSSELHNRRVDGAVATLRNQIYLGKNLKQIQRQFDDYTSNLAELKRLGRFCTEVAVGTQLLGESNCTEERLYVYGVNGRITLSLCFLSTCGLVHQRRLAEVLRGAALALTNGTEGIVSSVLGAVQSGEDVSEQPYCENANVTAQEAAVTRWPTCPCGSHARHAFPPCNCTAAPQYRHFPKNQTPTRSNSLRNIHTNPT